MSGVMRSLVTARRIKTLPIQAFEFVSHINVAESQIKPITSIAVLIHYGT
jgi:hypothetical protein